MNFKKILLFTVFISFLFTCKRNEVIDYENQIIPKPIEVKTSLGAFVLGHSTKIIKSKGISFTFSLSTSTSKLMEIFL